MDNYQQQTLRLVKYKKSGFITFVSSILESNLQSIGGFNKHSTLVHYSCRTIYFCGMLVIPMGTNPNTLVDLINILHLYITAVEQFISVACW
jgi:hypothetical protein